MYSFYQYGTFLFSLVVKIW